MGLLEELQNEAIQIRAREAQQNVELAAQKAFYRTHLQPVMLRACEYYEQVIENLNIVVPNIKVGYPLNPLLDKNVVLKQADYKFRSDNTESPHQIDISCRCTLQEVHRFYLPDQQLIKSHAQLLDHYNFPYHHKNSLDRNRKIRGATFVLDGPMIAHVRIAANPSGRNIHIIFRNIEQKPVNRYVFSSEAVDDELLEHVAMVFIRQVPMLVERTVDAHLGESLSNPAEQEKQEIAQAFPERAVAERARGLLKRFAFSGV